eukprot:COSAG02_NODE_349_length_24073_cov_102.816092_3_plen_107_part_00
MASEGGSVWAWLLFIPEKYVLTWVDSAPGAETSSGRSGWFTRLLILSTCLDAVPPVALLELTGNNTLPTTLIWAYSLTSVVGFGIMAFIALSILAGIGGYRDNNNR